MERKKIFFWGTPSLACPSLEALAKDEQVEIVGVGVMPDKKVGRKQVLTPCPVKKTAQALKLPIYEIANKEGLKKLTNSLSFDLGIVIAFGMIFPAEVLQSCPLGIVNVHFSLLPAYRGASPVQTAILEGERISGITWQRMVFALDAGDVLLSKSYDITGKGTKKLFQFFGEETALHMSDFIQAYTLDQSIIPIPQDSGLATFCGKFTKQDGLVTPSLQTAKEIYQRFLAFDLWPGIFLSTEHGNVKLKKVSLVETESAVELICCDDTSLWIEEAQVPGKKPGKASDIIKNYPGVFEEIKS